VVWREDMFRGYAEHMRSPDFLAAIDAVLAEAELAEAELAEAELAEAEAEPETHQVTVMCSESLWWRCHRRLVADFAAVARGIEVSHLMHDGRLEAHRPTPGVRLRDDGLLVYDAGQDQLM